MNPALELEALKALPRYGCGESDPDFRQMDGGNWINRDDALAALHAEQGREPYAWELLDQGCRAPDDCEDYLRLELAADINAEELARFQRAGRAWPLFKQPTPSAEQWVSVKERLPDGWQIRGFDNMENEWGMWIYASQEAVDHYKKYPSAHVQMRPLFAPNDSTDAGDKNADQA